MASIPSMLERPERNDPPQGRERGSRFNKIIIIIIKKLLDVYILNKK